jgi:hypothetical protein
MKFSIHGSTVIVLIGLILLSGLASLIADHSLASFQAFRAEYNLQKMSKHGLAGIEQEVLSLSKNLDELTEAAKLLDRKGVPTPEAIRELGAVYRVQVRQLERTNPADPAKHATDNYRLAMQGTVGATLRFLNALESKFRFDLQSASLRPANPEGTQVLLTLQFETEKP